MAATPGVPVPRAEPDAGLYGAAGDLNLPHSRTGLEGGTWKGLPGGAPGPINVRVGVMLHLGSLPCPATCCEAAGARGWQQRKTRCRTQRFLLPVHTRLLPHFVSLGEPQKMLAVTLGCFPALLSSRSFSLGCGAPAGHGGVTGNRRGWYRGGATPKPRGAPTPGAPNGEFCFAMGRVQQRGPPH